MKRIAWKTVAELVGIAAIVASLVFVGFQLRQSQSIALAERDETRAANAVELANTINQDPEIWARGLAGEHLDEIEAIVFGNMMLAWNDSHFYAQDASRELGFSSSMNYWTYRYGVFLYTNPGARQWFEAHQSEILELERLSEGAVDPGDWYGRIKSVWAEIERTEDLGSGNK